MRQMFRRENRKKAYLHQERMFSWLQIITILVVGLVSGQLGGGKWAKAASCNVTLSMEETSVDVGNAFVVTVGIEAEEAISGVEMMITYDADSLEYLTGSPQVSGEEGSLKISDLDMASNDTTAKYVIKFEVKKAGTSYVKVNSNPSIYNESSGQSMSIASNVLTVVGNAPEDTSGNTELKSLKISGGVMNPEFSREVSEYTVTVDAGVKKLIISAEAEDPSATVKVKGADSLKIGENQITVIVTAQNGDTKDYNIVAICEEEQESSNGEETTDPSSGENAENENSSGQEPVTMEPVTATKEGDQVVLTTYAFFVVEELTNETLLPSGYESTTMLIDGCSVTVYQNVEEKSDFVLLYASREGTEPTFYQYDKKEQTLQRLNQLLMIEEAKDAMSDNVSSTSGNHSKVYGYLLIGLSVLSILFMGTTAILYKKRR